MTTYSYWQERALAAEARLTAVQAVIETVRAHSRAVRYVVEAAESAALAVPADQPATTIRNGKIRSELIPPDSPQNLIAKYGTPYDLMPADQPATCEHGRTEKHTLWPDRGYWDSRHGQAEHAPYCNCEPRRCPGPTPDETEH